MEISLGSFSFHSLLAIYLYKAEVTINPTKKTFFFFLSGAQDPFLIQAGAYVDKVGMDHSAQLHIYSHIVVVQCIATGSQSSFTSHGKISKAYIQ